VSALTPKADIRGYGWNVRFVPKADMATSPCDVCFIVAPGPSLQAIPRAEVRSVDGLWNPRIYCEAFFFGQFLTLSGQFLTLANKFLSSRTIIALHASRLSARNFSPPLHVSNPTEDIMLAPELSALLVVMAFVLLFVFAVLDSARLGLTARTEHIARSIGARMLG